MRRKYWKYIYKKETEHNIAHIENLLQTSKGKQTNKLKKKCTKFIITVVKKKEPTKVRKYA